jgi:hypothetical protein
VTNFPPGMRRIDPDAEAARLAEARKDPAAQARTTASGTCQDPDCTFTGEAEEGRYVAQLILAADRHAAVSGHKVRTEVWSVPVEAAGA